MIVSVNVPGWNEVRTPNGRPLAVIVSPEDFARMQTEMQELRSEVERLRSRVNEMLQTCVVAPMTSEEVVAAVRDAGNQSAFIVDMRKRATDQDSPRA